MQRKQRGWVPVADTLADLHGPVTATRDASPQARHHFTQAIKSTSLSRPAKRIQIWASWRGCWRCDPYPSCKCRVGNIRSCNMRTTAIP